MIDTVNRRDYIGKGKICTDKGPVQANTAVQRLNPLWNCCLFILLQG